MNNRSVLINNMEGIKKMMSLDICVPPTSPCISQEVEDCSVNEGEAALFSCCVGGNPHPTVTWYRSDEEIKESRQYTMLIQPVSTDNLDVFKHVLVISRCGADLAGCYTCVAVNTMGSVSSCGELYVQADRALQGSDLDAETFPDKQPVEVKKESVDNYFTLLDEVGRGKYGIVYKCVHNDTKREYAAKVSKCRSPSQRKVILQEIDILNRLKHPLIIDMIDAFEYSRQIVVILEFVAGGELFLRLMEEELISERDVTFYIKQLLRAVAYIHSKGILHLDLKPENIMLVDKNSTQIKLIDFSLACTIAQGESTKVICGTVGFCSPEVINYDPVSTATDLWSVGVIAFVLLASFSPFHGDTESEISSNIMRCEWSCDDPVFEDVSDGAKDFISTLIIKEPERRATCQECLQHSWFRTVEVTKKIKTSQLISFIAKKNWRKTITAVRTTTFLSRIKQNQFHAENDEIVTEGFESERLAVEKDSKQLTWNITVTPIIVPKFTINVNV